MIVRIIEMLVQEIKRKMFERLGLPVRGCRPNLADTPNGKFLFDTGDIYIASHFAKGEVFEHQFINGPLRAIVEGAKVIVDVGANIGSHAVSYLRMNPSCRVYAFEPQEALHSLLQQNVEINEVAGRAEIFRCGLAHLAGESSLCHFGYVYDAERRGYNKGGVGLGYGGERIELRTLDSLRLPTLELIKIDVEGAEGLVLLGGAETIKKFKPAVFFEFNEKRIDPKLFGLPSIPTPFEVLKKLGYRNIQSVGGDNYLTCE